MIFVVFCRVDHEATAYLLLRPFMKDVPRCSFCGANPGKVQDLFTEFHQKLIDCLVPIPDVQPGWGLALDGLQSP